MHFYQQVTNVREGGAVESTREQQILVHQSKLLLNKAHAGVDIDRVLLAPLINPLACHLECPFLVLMDSYDLIDVAAE